MYDELCWVTVRSHQIEKIQRLHAKAQPVENLQKMETRRRLPRNRVSLCCSQPLRELLKNNPLVLRHIRLDYFSYYNFSMKNIIIRAIWILSISDYHDRISSEWLLMVSEWRSAFEYSSCNSSRGTSATIWCKCIHLTIEFNILIIGIWMNSSKILRLKEMFI